VHEDLAIGQAVQNLIDQQRQGKLPRIPIGGASDDPGVQADRDAFDKWIKHKGPRPDFTPLEASDAKPAGATASQTSPVKLAFRDCLISNAKRGNYTSKDGGKSAIMLMSDACSAEWDAWHRDCVAEGGTEGGVGGCTMPAGFLAQATLKLLGK